MGAGAGPRSGRGDREAGRDAGAGTDRDPSRSDAGVAVRVLPGRARDHGVRPGDDAEHRDRRTGVRRRPSPQLRAVRHTRASPGVRSQRLRRDAARAVGVGPEAARGQPRGRRAQHRRRRRGHRSHRARLGRRVLLAPARAGRPGDARRLVLENRCRRRQRRHRLEACADDRRQVHRQGEEPDEPAGARKADDDRRWTARASSTIRPSFSTFHP